MDDTVKQAMLKWPNVPACFGWLALDGRGRWRMRDEQAQAAQLPGEVIVHQGLLGFINRHYLADKDGCWYFQNGPQRVYVDLAATPFIARTDPTRGLVSHTGDMLSPPDAVWITEMGNLVFQSGSRIALLDDRDLAQCLNLVRCGGASVTDDDLLTWLGGASAIGSTADCARDGFCLLFAGTLWPLQPIKQNALAQRFGFVCTPRPASG